ncbi:MAG: MFS transporter [Solirubrobacteraceae bacterium]
MTNAHTPAKAGRREWLGLAVLSLPCLLIALDASVLNLAVPAISADLHPSSSQLLWILDIYSFILAGSLITMGRLGDRIGRRRLLMVGAGAFGLASALASASDSATALIVSRGALGLAGATLMPSTLGLIREMFPDERQRAAAIGVWGASLSLGGAVGPLIGGALLTLSSWHAVFLPAVPVMGLLLLFGPRTLPEARDPAGARLDLASAALSTAAILATVYGFKHYAMHGPDAISSASVAAGLALGTVFIRRQARLEDPLVDLSLFRRAAFTASLAGNALGFALIAGIGLLVGQELQLVHGLTALQAGVWGVPTFAAFIAGDLAAPLLVRRLSPASVIAGGLMVAAAGFLLLTDAEHDGLTVLVSASVISSLGLAPVFNLAASQALEHAPAGRAGAVSGLSETSTELGFALGLALLGAFASAVYRSGVHVAAARDSLGAAIHLGSPAVANTARHAFTHALSVTSALGAGLAILAAAALVTLLTRERRRAQVELLAGA